MLTNTRFSENTCNLDEIVEKYSTVMNTNYDKQERQLLDALYREVKVLKKEVAMFKKEVSCENIEKLINQKRREKEKERQVLQNRWRQCNQSYKASQEQQKKLINQQKEDAFDLQNLKTKIEEFRTHIDKAKTKAANDSHQKQLSFMTEAKQNYQSPYKFASSNAQLSKAINEKQQKLLASSSAFFFTSKYKLNKCKPLQLNLETRPNFADTTKSSRFESSFDRTKNFNLNLNKDVTERQSNLQTFLNDPSVRLKLFKILKKQI